MGSKARAINSSTSQNVSNNQGVSSGVNMNYGVNQSGNFGQNSAMGGGSSFNQSQQDVYGAQLRSYRTSTGRLRTPLIRVCLTFRVCAEVQRDLGTPCRPQVRAMATRWVAASPLVWLARSDPTPIRTR